MSDRERVRNAASTDSAQRASLRADIASIDQAELAAYTAARQEIYRGFNELSELLMSPDASDAAPATDRIHFI